MILIWQERVIFTGEQLAELSLRTHLHTHAGAAFCLIHTVSRTHSHTNPCSLFLSLPPSHTHKPGTCHRRAASGNIMRESERSANGID